MKQESVFKTSCLRYKLLKKIYLPNSQKIEDELKKINGILWVRVERSGMAILIEVNKNVYIGLDTLNRVLRKHHNEVISVEQFITDLIDETSTTHSTRRRITQICSILSLVVVFILTCLYVIPEAYQQFYINYQIFSGILATFVIIFVFFSSLVGFKAQNVHHPSSMIFLISSSFSLIISWWGIYQNIFIDSEADKFQLFNSDRYLFLFFVYALLLAFLHSFGRYLHHHQQRLTVKFIERIGRSINKYYYVRENAEDSSYSELKPHQLASGQIIKLKSGDVIPCDGVVTSGFAVVNLEILDIYEKTNEVGIGTKVNAGCKIMKGELELYIEESIEESTIYSLTRKIISNLQANNPLRFQTDRILNVGVVGVVIFALAVGVLHFTDQLGSSSNSIQDSMLYGFLNGALVLIASAPPGFTLTYSLPSFIAQGWLNKRGIKLRDSISIRDIALCDTLTIESSGILTYGDAQLVKVLTINYNENNIDPVLYAAALVKNFNLPITHTFVEYCTEKGLSIPSVEYVKLIGGFGIKGEINGVKVLIGSAIFLAENGIMIEKIEDKDIEAQPTTQLNIAINDIHIARFEIKYSIRNSLKRIIHDLSRLSIKPILISNEPVAYTNYLARQMLIPKYFSEVTPQTLKGIIHDFAFSGYRIASVISKVEDEIMSYVEVNTRIILTNNQKIGDWAEVIIHPEEPEKVAVLFKYLSKLPKIAHGMYVLTIWVTLIPLIVASGFISILKFTPLFALIYVISITALFSGLVYYLMNKPQHQIDKSQNRNLPDDF